MLYLSSYGCSIMAKIIITTIMANIENIYFSTITDIENNMYLMK